MDNLILKIIKRKIINIRFNDKKTIAYILVNLPGKNNGFIWLKSFNKEIIDWIANYIDSNKRYDILFYLKQEYYKKENLIYGVITNIQVHQKQNIKILKNEFEHSSKQKEAIKN